MLVIGWIQVVMCATSLANADTFSPWQPLQLSGEQTRVHCVGHGTLGKRESQIWGRYAFHKYSFAPKRCLCPIWQDITHISGHLIEQSIPTLPNILRSSRATERHREVCFSQHQCMCWYLNPMQYGHYSQPNLYILWWIIYTTMLAQRSLSYIHLFQPANIWNIFWLFRWAYIFVIFDTIQFNGFNLYSAYFKNLASDNKIIDKIELSWWPSFLALF